MAIANCEEKSYELYSRYERSGRDYTMTFGEYVEWLSTMEGERFWAWLFDAPFLTAVPLSNAQIPKSWIDELDDFIRQYCND